jgi:hypothetical protein
VPDMLAAADEVQIFAIGSDRFSFFSSTGFLDRTRLASARLLRNYPFWTIAELTAASEIVPIAEIRKFQKETGRCEERTPVICGGQERERQHDLAEIGTRSPKRPISVVQGSSFPVCVYCGCSFKRRRKAAIYCSAICAKR